MKPIAAVEINALVKMIDSENRAEYSRYIYETTAPLSRICESADALGPLHLKEKLSFTRWKLSGEVFYSRFRPGDRVEVRIKKPNADLSLQLSKDWKVENISYPSPGKIEMVISGVRPLDVDGIQEIFLFRSSSTLFNNILRKKLYEISSSKEEVLLGTGAYTLFTKDRKFKEHYERLNNTQKNAIEYLIDGNLSGAIQGPPGTGKTHLLKALIVLALQSNMKVCVTSFTNAAVDNLLGRVVVDKFSYDWVRVGDPDKVRKELYPKDIGELNFISTAFGEEVKESNLIGATLHKLAFNKSAPKVDLLVIDEAGQVPIYFWPFIQRLARRVVLVGDQFQLPPVLAAKHAELPCDNVFSLLIGEETPMLETQYRMRSEIQAWSSEKFYKGKLTPHTSVASRDFFADSPAFLTDGFVVPKKIESHTSEKSSLNEANFIADKIEKLRRSKGSVESIGVICPYRVQAGLVNATLQNRLGVDEASKVLVDTVERFQGQEREAIFLSFGSAGAAEDELSFLSDPKRLNVSITRAKSRFYCLFNSQLWENSRSAHSEDLNEFLRWMTYGRTSIKRAA
ncbi:DEAD/DEAH box helicase [Bdellovibrio sp. HCB-110]|uniref:DEAD/DEAH box helicase n=1 Tax=Bdellovibrio sp. HCB-110 TaxID=3391182 RepID=UPI0039B56CA2